MAGQTNALIRLSFLLISLVASGCWSRAEIDWPDRQAREWTEASPEVEQTAFRSMSTVERAHLDGAWKALRERAFGARVQATIADESGMIVGRQSRTLAFTPAEVGWSRSVASADSSGSFERSFWSRFSELDQTLLTEGGFAGLAVPDDPLFLSEQGPSYYRYRPLGDTLIGENRVDVYESMTRPETTRPGVQRARWYVAGGQLVGMDVTFVQQSFLYQERSDFRILLQPDGDRWLPARVSIRSTVGVPFSRGRSYAMRIDYLDLGSTHQTSS